MRFVSNSANLCLGNYRNAKEVIAPATEVVINGVKRATTPEAYVAEAAMPIQFSLLGLTADDIAAAKAQLAWRGLPTEGDEVTPIDPAEFGRIGVWDSCEFQNTYRLSDTERQEAERMLLGSPELGRLFVRVEAVRVAAPWATYDATHHSKIAAIAEQLGCVAQALAYEQQTKDRPSVVAVLERALTQTPAVTEPEAAPAKTQEEVVLA